VYRGEVGRPRIFKNAKEVTFRIEYEEYEVLKRLALSRGLTVSEYLRELIREHLREEGNIKEESEEKEEIDERLIKIYKAQFIAQLTHIKGVIEKEYETIHYVISDAEKRLKELLNPYYEDPYTVKNLERDRDFLLQKLDELSKSLSVVMRIQKEVKRLRLDDISEKAKKLGTRISDIVNKISHVLDQILRYDI